MTYPMVTQEWSKSYAFTTIVCVKDLYFVMKEIFNKQLELRKNNFQIKFLFHWIEPNVACEMINKHAIISKTINR